MTNKKIEKIDISSDINNALKREGIKRTSFNVQITGLVLLADKLNEIIDKLNENKELDD